MRDAVGEGGRELARAGRSGQACDMSAIAAATYEFSVEEYQRMGEVGFFQEDDRVELLNGNIVLMPPIGYRHMGAVRRINRLFQRQFSEHCEIDVQSSVIIDGKSEPQPDVVLLHDRVNQRESPPLAEDVFLLVEVADSSLFFDLKEKREAYARSGISEYWLLDLTRNELRVFREPAGSEYGDERTLRAEDLIAPLAFPDVEIRVSAMLPP